MFEPKSDDMFKSAGTLLLVLFSWHVFGQIKITDAGLLVQNRHIWRGSKLGNAPSIEPSVTFSANRLHFNFWAAATPDNSYSEIDLIPSFQFNHFQLTLFDYYNPVRGAENQFLNFSEDRNRHSIELAFDNFSTETQRLKWMIGTFLTGDKNQATGKQNYSTYIEFRYPITFFKLKIEPFTGITPFGGYYADWFAIINAGIGISKSLKLSSRVSIPFNLLLISNPYQRFYFFNFSSGIVISGR
jgi:hypothetical protein